MEKQGDDVVFVATDETVDRHNESIPLDSWDTENYLKSPRLLVDHDHRVEKIVGRAMDVKTNSRRMTFRPEFHGITTLSREVEAMVKAGHLDTVSVGFIPHPPAQGEEYGKNELVEISFVTVPANPNARRIKSLLEESEKDEEKGKVEKFMEGVVVKEFEGTMRFKATEVQTLIFSKEKFGSEATAKKWATDHNFLADKIDETQNSFRIQQFDPEKCAEGSERTITLEEGVKAVVCRNDDQKCAKPEEKLDTSDTVEASVGKQQKAPQKSSARVEPKQKQNRRLSKDERVHKIMEGAIKQSVHVMSYALHEINKIKR